MRILYCVQRYGAGIAGGAEAACRNVAERMVARGHHVEVITSCALNYDTWADHFEPGTEEINGVIVHRLPVRAPRDIDAFGPLHGRTISGHVPLAVERDWLRVNGPEVVGLTEWIDREVHRFDVVDVFTYLFMTAGLGTRVAAARVPTVLHPTAHDEPAFWLDVFRPMFDAASAMAFLTPEEMELAGRRLGRRRRADELVGLGVGTDAVGDGDRFRREHDLGDGDLVVYLGRLDPGKGPDELYRFMVSLMDSGRTSARLLVVGQQVITLPEHPGVIFTGFVDEQTKHDALAAATVFVQPSYFESFSLSLCEAWVEGRPALVQGRCDVLRGQAARSRGGIPYTGLAEFDAALARLLADPALRDQLGHAGRQYVVANYQWDTVLDRYEQLLARAIGERRLADHSLTSPRGPSPALRHAFDRVP